VTEQMKAFLEELATLLEKHEVELEGYETDDGPMSHCDGIEITQESKWDGTELIRDRCEVILPRWTKGKDIRNYLAKAK